MFLEKFQYPKHPVPGVICGPSCCGQSVSLTFLILNINNSFYKTYIYSPSLHFDFFQNFFKSSSNYKLIDINPNILNEEDFDIVSDEKVINKDFQKANTEIETYETIEELNGHQDFDSYQPIVFILDDLNQLQLDEPLVQILFKKSRHIIISIFIISQE